MSASGANNIMDGISPIGHTLSTSAIVLSVFGYLSPLFTAIATSFSIIWFGIAIYESKTFQHWNRNRLMKKKAKKIASLRAKEKVIVAELEALELVRSAKSEAREKVAVAKSEAADIVAKEAIKVEIERS
jgi:hypothetical protein